MSGFGYCVSVLDGNVLLAPSDPGDERQERFGVPIHDDEGNPAFYLVNKANSVRTLALENTFGQSHMQRMVLVHPDPATLDESLMWTETGDVGHGFSYIRALNKNNTRLNNDDGGVHDGTTVVVSEGAMGDCQIWKIVSWGREGGSPGRTVRIFCKADEGLSATVRDGAVVLEPTNHQDQCQHWFMHMTMRHGNHVKDAQGYQAFALVNKVTGKAIKPSSQGEGHPVELERYNHPDESVLWTVGRDMGGGFRCIRMATNIRLKFGALDAGAPNGKMKQKGKATEDTQCFGHPISNHYCWSCLQKRLYNLRLPVSNK